MYSPNMKNLILYNIREEKEISFAKLLEKIYGVPVFPRNTGRARFCNIIIDMYKARFFDISDQDTVAVIREFKGKTYLHSGYELAAFLERSGKMDSIIISLTEYFYRMQDVIGFSLTDQYVFNKMAEANAVFAKPIWKRANPKVNCEVFVIMPFEKNFLPVYEDHIRKVCDGIGVTCLRADIVLKSSDIMDDIWSLIFNCQVVICDCTGQNPNVFYELGIAHSLGKPTICITQNEDDIPFDIQQLRYIKYVYTPRGMSEFERTLEQYIGIMSAEGIEHGGYCT